MSHLITSRTVIHVLRVLPVHQKRVTCHRCARNGFERRRQCMTTIPRLPAPIFPSTIPSSCYHGAPHINWRMYHVHVQSHATSSDIIITGILESWVMCFCFSPSELLKIISWIFTWKGDTSPPEHVGIMYHYITFDTLIDICWEIFTSWLPSRLYKFCVMYQIERRWG